MSSRGYSSSYLPSRSSSGSDGHAVVSQQTFRSHRSKNYRDEIERVFHDRRAAAGGFYSREHHRSRGGGGSYGHWNGGGSTGAEPPRVQESSNGRNDRGTAGPHANDVDRKDENESDISPQAQLSLQPIEELGGESNTRARVPPPARSSPNFTGISLQAAAQGLIGPVYFLTPVIKLPQLLNRREDNVSTDGGNTHLSRLEAGEIYNLSQISRVLHNIEPQEDAGEYGVTTSPVWGATSSMVQPDSTIAANTSPVTLPQNKRPCYYLLGGLSIGLVTSLALALWWARSRGDLSAGFTLGSYVVGVDALVVAAAAVFHAPSCRCWIPSVKSED
ncbi:hypothetical protein F5B21DRAFT_180060 [Xylaria acuta]|nr:hypothetical protein F5B21DRAFT_180060 [Xylaria acuta]